MKRYWNPRASTVEQVPNEVVVSCEQPGIMAAPHWHAQAEVNYVFRGAVDYEMHGPQGRYRMRIEAGAVALFWGGLPHRVVDTAEDTYFHAVHLPIPQFFRLRLAPDLQQRLMQGATLLTLEPQDDDAPAFTRRAAFLRSGDPRQVAHALDELLLRLERMALEPHRLHEPEAPGRAPEEPGEAASSQTIRRLCGFIAEHFRDDIDCAAIAGAAGLHPKYAMSAFKRATGLSLGEYLSLLRVSYAQGLLVNGDASVLQVAMESGFGSVSAFNKGFRRKAGMTPSEFKRRHRVPAARGGARRPEA